MKNQLFLKKAIQKMEDEGLNPTHLLINPKEKFGINSIFGIEIISSYDVPYGQAYLIDKDKIIFDRTAERKPSLLRRIIQRIKDVFYTLMNGRDY